MKAGDPALRSATVRVQELTTAKGKATTVANQWTGALTLIPGPLGQITSQATTLTSALRGPGGLVAGMAAVAAAGVGLLKSLGDDIERLDNLKRQTGLAVSSLQAFEQAAREAGESPDTLVQGLGRVNQAINDVLMGTANAGKAFQAIGVDLRAMVRDGASTEQILEATAKALAAIPDPTARAAAQMELFGTRGRAMSTVLDAIAQKSLPGYVDELREAGVVTSEETNKMAREFDAMFDRMTRASVGFWTQFKADAAAAIVNVSKMLKLTGEIFADPAAAGRMVQAQSAHEIVRPGVLPAGPMPRVVPPSPDETKAAEKAIKDALGLENATRQLNEAWKEGLELGQRYTEVLNKMEFDRLNEDAKKAEESLTAYDISLTTTTDDLLENNRAVDGAVGFFQAWGEEADGVRGILVNLRSELQGLPPSIMAVRTEADQTFIRMRDVVEGADGSVERLARQIREELPSAFQQFEAGFEAASEQLAARFQDWTILGGETALALHTAFSDLGVALVKDFESVGDAWEHLLDTILRMIIDFLAAEAVQQLLNLGKDIVKNLGSGDGDSSFNILDPDTWFQTKRADTDATTESQKRLELEQQRTDESTRQLTLEEAKNAGGRAGRGIGGAIGGVVGGAGGGATPLGPFGAIGGEKVGREVFGFVGEIIGDFIGSLLGLKDNVDEMGTAATQVSVSAMNAAVAQNGLAEDLDPATAAANQAAQASRDLTAAQTDLAVETHDLTASTNAATEATAATTESLSGFSDGLEGLGEGIAAAVESANAAADRASGAASDAAASADRAHSGADRGRGFGGQGTPGGAPDVTGDSPSSDKGFGGDGTGGGPGAFQTGLLEGPVRRTGLARVHQGEVVATPNQAAAILSAIQRGGDGPETVKQLRRIADLLDRATRVGGRPAGATV